MKRCILTYADGAHEELLDISLPLYKEFARQHGYDMVVGKKLCEMPAAWNKVLLLQSMLMDYESVTWFDCDLVITDMSEDFPTTLSSQTHDSASSGDFKYHSLVRHFENNSEVPNTGVWILGKSAVPMLRAMTSLEVFTNHGWWEQAALMTLMGYCVPPEGSHFPDTMCKCLVQTDYWRACQFMRICWNSHPNYRAEKPRIVHCSYLSMLQRVEVMRALVKDPTFNYPGYGSDVEKGIPPFETAEEGDW